MSAELAKIPYSVLLFPTLDAINSTDSKTEGTSSSKQYRDITGACVQLNMFQHMFRPLEVVIKLAGVSATEIVESMGQRPGFFISISHLSAYISRMMAVDKIDRTYDEINGESVFIVSLKAIETLWSPKFSRNISGGIQDVIGAVYDTIYDLKDLNQFKPPADLTGDSVFAPTLLQYQTFEEYIAESRDYAIASDFSPYLVYQTFERLIGVSIRDLLSAAPVEIVISSPKTAGLAMYKPLDITNAVGFYASDFRNDLVLDLNKYSKLDRTRYVTVQPNGTVTSYTSLPARSSNQIIEELEQIVQGYEFDDQLDKGIACLIRRHCKKLLESAICSFQMLLPAVALRPGDLVNINISSGGGTQKNTYMVIRTEAATSNKAGQQLVFAVDIRPIKDYLDGIGLNHSELLNKGFAQNDN